MALIIKTDKIPCVPAGIGTQLKSLRTEQVIEIDEAIVSHPLACLWIEVKRGVAQHMSIFHKNGGRILRPRKDYPAA